MTFSALSPCLAYRDAPAALSWIESALAGRVLERHDDDLGRVVHAEVAVGAGRVLVASADIGMQLPPGGCLYLVAAEETIAADFARAGDAGAEVVRPLAPTDYGSQDFIVRDPEGVLWCVGTYPPAQEFAD